jgi:hypothetical protein
LFLWAPKLQFLKILMYIISHSANINNRGCDCSSTCKPSSQPSGILTPCLVLTRNPTAKQCETGNSRKVPKPEHHMEQMDSSQIVLLGIVVLTLSRNIPNDPFKTLFSSGPKLGHWPKAPDYSLMNINCCISL